MILGALLGCGGGSGAPSNDAPLGGWIARVAADPGAFDALVDPHRDTWIALHANALAVAAEGPEACAATREARLRLARTHATLDAASVSAWAGLEAELRARAALPADSAFWEVARRRAEPPPAATVDAAERDALTAIVDGERRYFPPRAYAALAAAWASRADALPATDDPLGAALFGPDLGPWRLALPDVDDPTACADALRAFDAGLDERAAALDVTPEGRALVDALALVDVGRARHLEAAAVAALDAGRPRCALLAARGAADPERPRAISPVNSPGLHAVTAAAALRAGAAREALDALEPLRTPLPSARGVIETVGALTVAQGMSRYGDSREN